MKIFAPVSFNNVLPWVLGAPLQSWLRPKSDYMIVNAYTKSGGCILGRRGGELYPPPPLLLSLKRM